MWPNPQKTADLVAFTEKIRNGKFHFLCSEKGYISRCYFTVKIAIALILNFIQIFATWMEKAQFFLFKFIRNFNFDYCHVFSLLIIFILITSLSILLLVVLFMSKTPKKTWWDALCQLIDCNIRITDVFSKSHLLKKSLMENFIFCEV